MNTRIEQILEFLKEDSQDSFLRYALALEYVKINESEKAITVILKLIEDEPNYVASYYQLGKLYEAIGQIDNALETFSKGMEKTKNEINRKTYLELKEAYNLLLDDHCE